ncbi:MAG TPA: alpha/beta hydrolase domain-containing protein [Polyangiaceae bacterium]|nr:alpha/beta hydrolase domain-containing protein [Polyangiaceae bacterium]
MDRRKFVRLRLLLVCSLGVVAAVPGIACSSSSSTPGPHVEPPADASAADVDAGNAPLLTGPVMGPGRPFTSALVDLAAAGYVEEEYFLEGDASAYDWQTPPGDDGAWSVRTTTTAHFKTRFLVRRPTDATRFNGSVFVEWLNVSGGIDADPDFGYAHVELLRSGWAYVGVSAQAEGVVGGGFSLVPGQQPLVQWNPQRYGSLTHPGDDYSYDIFTQVARAVRSPGAAVHPLGALVPARFVAAGESQSAIRMVTYADAIQPVAKAFDGIFIHSRAGGAAALSAGDAGPLAGLLGGGPPVAHIRADLGVPVFQFLTETDVLGAVGLTGFAGTRQPDTDRLRTWEVAGTSHADQYLLDYNAALASEAGSPTQSCTNVNTGPQHWVEDAAVSALQAWLKDGTPPAQADALTLSDAGDAYVKDSIGNTLGGVRTAAVDVPIAVYSGQSSSSSILCSLFGNTTALSAAQLASLYPTHDDYVGKVTAATSEAQQAGFVVAADVPLIDQEAGSAPVPQ